MGEVMKGGTLDRRQVVASLLEGREDVLVPEVLGHGWGEPHVLSDAIVGVFCREAAER